MDRSPSILGRITLALLASGWVLPFWVASVLLRATTDSDSILGTSFPVISMGVSCFIVGCVWLFSVLVYWALRWDHPGNRWLALATSGWVVPFAVGTVLTVELTAQDTVRKALGTVPLYVPLAAPERIFASVAFWSVLVTAVWLAAAATAIVWIATRPANAHV